MIDDSRFPIVFLTCPSELTSAFLTDFEQSYERLFARRAKFVVVCDLRMIAKVPDALMRKRLSDILNRPDFKAQQERYQVGSANVIASAAVRAALTALLWVWQPTSPMYAPRDHHDAIEWSISRLREVGVTIPPSLASLAQTYRPDDARRAN